MTDAQILALRRRPFPVRFRDSYRIYRRLNTPVLEALWMAWVISI